MTATKSLQPNPCKTNIYTCYVVFTFIFFQGTHSLFSQRRFTGFEKQDDYQRPWYKDSFSKRFFLLAWLHTQMHQHTTYSALNIVWYEHLITGREWFSGTESHFNCLKRKFHAVIEKHFTNTASWSTRPFKISIVITYIKKIYNKTFSFISFSVHESRFC